MIVTIHRWQPKTNRFQKQRFELHSPGLEIPADTNYSLEKSFLGMCFDGRQRLELGYKNFRTQHVDRIEVNPFGETGIEIDIFTSPVVERNYSRGSLKAKLAKAELATEVYTPLPSSANTALIENICACCCDGCTEMDLHCYTKGVCFDR